MLHWLIQTIAENIVALGLGMAIGYGIHWHRSHLKVSLATYIEQSWSDRSIHMSITNHGNTPITVDSWTVHIPLEELLPGIAKREDKPDPPQLRHLTSIHRISRRIRHHMFKWDRIAMANDLNRSFARSLLNEPHWRHELLAPGTRQRIEAGESAVRSFPRTSAVRQTQAIASSTQNLTIIPSCHVVGRRHRIWGSPSFLGGGSMPIATQIDPPRIDAED